MSLAPAAVVESPAAPASHYTHSPACALVASHCACCGQPLVDAVSVETGIGPWCRKNHGYKAADVRADWDGVDAALEGTDALEVVRTEKIHHRLTANYLVYRIACEPFTRDAQRYVAALYRVGFVALARRIAKRVEGVVVDVEGGELVVTAPKSARLGDALYRAGVRSTWDRDAKVRRVAATDRSALWRVLRAALPAGTVVVGPNGATLVGL